MAETLGLIFTHLVTAVIAGYVCYRIGAEQGKKRQAKAVGKVIEDVVKKSSDLSRAELERLVRGDGDKPSSS